MTPRSLWAVWDAHLPDSPEQSLCGHTPATAGPQVGRPRGPRGQSPRPVHGQWTAAAVTAARGPLPTCLLTPRPLAVPRLAADIAAVEAGEDAGLGFSAPQGEDQPVKC